MPAVVVPLVTSPGPYPGRLLAGRAHHPGRRELPVLAAPRAAAPPAHGRDRGQRQRQVQPLPPPPAAPPRGPPPRRGRGAAAPPRRPGAGGGGAGGGGVGARGGPSRPPPPPWACRSP